MRAIVYYQGHKGYPDQDEEDVAPELAFDVTHPVIAIIARQEGDR